MIDHLIVIERVITTCTLIIALITHTCNIFFEKLWITFFKKIFLQKLFLKNKINFLVGKNIFCF